MSAAMWTALGGIVTALVVGAFGLLTSRTSTKATSKTDAVAGFSQLTDQLQEERAALQDTITSLREATACAQQTANDALAAANRATALVADLVREVEPIVTWIDNGASPPPPDLSMLRAILTAHQRTR